MSHIVRKMFEIVLLLALADVGPGFCLGADVPLGGAGFKIISVDEKAGLCRVLVTGFKTDEARFRVIAAKAGDNPAICNFAGRLEWISLPKAAVEEDLKKRYPNAIFTITRVWPADLLTEGELEIGKGAEGTEPVVIPLVSGNPNDTAKFSVDESALSFFVVVSDPAANEKGEKLANRLDSALRQKDPNCTLRIRFGSKDARFKVSTAALAAEVGAAAFNAERFAVAFKAKVQWTGDAPEAPEVIAKAAQKCLARLIFLRRVVAGDKPAEFVWASPPAKPSDEVDEVSQGVLVGDVQLIEVPLGSLDLLHKAHFVPPLDKNR